jgi:UDP-N-acetylmuramate dehydrogenase
MRVSDAVLDDLARIEGLQLTTNASLSAYSRFGLGGPAAALVDASTEDAMIEALDFVRRAGVRWEIIGGGSNLICADAGFEGVVLRYVADSIRRDDTRVVADAGAVLQTLVDFTIESGLAGIHTMTGIPGWVGGAIYGNAGAYGRSIDQSVTWVRFFDGTRIREFSNEECRFRYRDSTFKDNKGWVIFSCELELTEADVALLRKQADEILTIRNAKYPPTMKCAGSIFKNLFYADLPDEAQRAVDPKVVREGKVPSAYFLEAVGAKGTRNGGIYVADYHANLIYNAGGGTAEQVREIVEDLKARVRKRFAFDVAEEVQYVGF